MNIRIISGRFGGRRLDAPDGARTHPMSERIRNALFNRLSSYLDGATVLDAFAGTGAVGLEALSRGAKHAVFIERDRIAQRVLASNVAVLGCSEDTTIIRTTVSNWLQTRNEALLFEIVFADPPYHDTQDPTLVRLAECIKPKGLYIISYPVRDVTPEVSGCELIDEREYGNAKILIYRKR